RIVIRSANDPGRSGLGAKLRHIPLTLPNRGGTAVNTSFSVPARGHQNSSASLLITQSAPKSVAAIRAMRVTTSICENGSGRPMGVEEVPNVIAGEHAGAPARGWFEKLRPADGELLCRVARSGAAEADTAVRAARAAQPAWAGETPVERGRIVREIALTLQAH